MRQRCTTAVVAALLLVSLLAGVSEARMSIEAEGRGGTGRGFAQQQPCYCLVAHRIGQIVLGVANNGSLGAQNIPQAGGSDCFTGEAVPDCEYPKNSNMQYLYSGAFWIGAVVGRDTLVTVGADGWQQTREMFPDVCPFGEMIYRSISDPEAEEYEDAISEEDYIAVYYDTITDGVDNDFFGRVHTPLNIEVTQSSYAWSYSYAEDFVLFDYRIKNIGTQTLEDVYMGVYIDADVKFEGESEAGFDDDLCGFLSVAEDTCGSCPYVDSTVFTAWIADADGDFERPVGTDGSIYPTVATTATRIVRTPSDSLDVSFNWWIGNGNPSLDFGPRERPYMGRWREEWRDFRTGGLGTPEGDANKYYSLRNQEFDYDQIYTGEIQPNDTLWMYPDQNRADSFANGYDTRYLLSFGPFEIDPGQTLPVSFAYVAGDSVHTQAANAAQFLPSGGNYDAGAYYDALDFSDLAKNSRWASWVYDNPGVDTDGDGYFGRYRVCPNDSVIDYVDTITEITEECLEPPCFDTVWVTTDSTVCWVRGDNVPDFRGASPPPAPEFWLTPSANEIHVRFNGLASETAVDVFSREQDFEGYRVYLSRDERSAAYMLMASYDRENYNKYILEDAVNDVWVLRERPYTLSELRCMYGEGENPCDDDTFDPLDYTRSRPYVHPLDTDSLFYFEPQDYNASEFGITTDISKIYPDEPYPSTIVPDSADPSELTEDGYLKYFEYEITLDNLLSSVPWYVNVTAFDYGSPVSGLSSLETPVDNGAQMVYALDTFVTTEEAYAFPNPYRIDAAYRDGGYEGRIQTDYPADRVRDIHFANLPPVCTIRIFTLDGDLVREIEHDVNNPPVDRDDCFTASTDCWNLITRNTQLVVSGLYYWTVDEPGGDTQIGKLVIIM